MSRKPTRAGQVGINCPNCGENLRHAYIAKSHPCPAGQIRRRYCPRCDAAVESIETVTGSSAVLLDLSGLQPGLVTAMRTIVREARRKADVRISAVEVGHSEGLEPQERGQQSSRAAIR